MTLDPSQLRSLETKIELLRPWAELETGIDFGVSRIERVCAAAGKVVSRRKSPASVDALLADSQQGGMFLEQLTTELTVGESNPGVMASASASFWRGTLYSKSE